MRFLNLTIVLIIWSSFSQILAKESNFHSGIKAYSDKNYSLAIKHFELELNSHPENLTANYNLALAYYKNGHKGKTILHLERYMKQNPNDQDVLDLLYQINIELNPELEYEESLNSFSRIIYGIKADSYAILSVVFGFISFVFVLYGRIGLRNKKKGIIQGVFYTFLFLSAVFVIAGFNSNEFRKNKNYGIVTSGSIPTYTDEKELTGKNLGEGVKVKIISKENKYFKVRTRDETIIFILSNDLEII